MAFSLSSRVLSFHSPTSVRARGSKSPMQTARKNVNADTAMTTHRFSFAAKPTANGKSLKAAAVPMKNPDSRAFPTSRIREECPQGSRDNRHLSSSNHSLDHGSGDGERFHQHLIRSSGVKPLHGRLPN